MAKLDISGRLGKEPERKTSKAGKDYATAFLIADANDANSENGWPINVAAFEDNVARLLKLTKGQRVTVAGTLSRYTTDEGKQYWNLAADEVRPGKRPQMRLSDGEGMKRWKVYERA